MMDETTDKMLQSWANYLLGSSEESQRTMAEGVSEEENTHASTLDILLRANLDENMDDDWVLISADPEEDSLDDIEVLNDHEVRLRRVPSVRALTRTSSSSSLHSNDIDVEESWFLTPPPCFTSTGPSNMRISPFENLLIEHPSMSVYNHAPTRRQIIREILSGSPVRETPSESDQSEDELEVEDVDEEVAIVRRVVRRYKMQVQLQERQYSKYVHSRKVQNQKANKPLKKAYLERNNKAREVNCRNHRQRRGERSQGANRSHANNNRKC